MSTSTKPQVVGTFDGQDVYEVRLQGEGGSEASIVTFGAAIRDLQVPAAEGNRRVILGFPAFEDQAANKSWHWGAVPGRFANRIAHGRFTLDDKQYQIRLNENNQHVCHGGLAGFGVRNWTVKKQGSNTVTLGLESVDGDEGFPGNLSAEVTYTLTPDSTLHIDWSATTDQATLINLTTHAFFNLNGTTGVNTLDHKLRFEADHYTPVDASLIPTGELKAVEGSPFDFRASRPIKHDVDGKPFHYDHNFALRDHTGKLRRAAELISSSGDLSMEVWTDQPGIQFFDGAPLDIAQPGHDGMKLGYRAGVCLEPQAFPDSINHDNFPSVVLRPGEKYNHRSEFRFRQL